MAHQNQNHVADPLGSVVKESIRAAVREEFLQMQAQLNNHAARTNAHVNELRVNHLRGEMLSKNHDFPSFCGRPMENFDEWIKKLEKQMLLKGMRPDDDALKLIFLEFHLEGDALTKFENISNSRNAPVTYDQFKNALSLAFPSQYDALYHRQLLNERKQGRHETVLAFYNELEKLARLAFPTFDEQARNNLLEPTFLTGLQYDVRQALRFKRFADLKTLVEEAVFVEREILRDSSSTIPLPSNRYSNFQRVEQVCAVQNSGYQQQINELNKKFDRLMDQLAKNSEKSPQKSRKSNITCNNCGLKGHYASECNPKPRKCEICQKTGHLANDCWSKCKHCQGKGHKHSDCPTKNRKCSKCNENGHYSEHCPKSMGQQNFVSGGGDTSISPFDCDDPDFYAEAPVHIGGRISTNFAFVENRSLPAAGLDQEKSKNCHRIDFLSSSVDNQNPCILEPKSTGNPLQEDPERLDPSFGSTSAKSKLITSQAENQNEHSEVLELRSVSSPKNVTSVISENEIITQNTSLSHPSPGSDFLHVSISETCTIVPLRPMNGLSSNRNLRSIEQSAKADSKHVKNGIRTRGFYGNQNFSMNPFTLCILIFLAPCASCFQLCGTGLTGHSIEIPKKISCTRPEFEGTPVITKGEVYVPRSNPLQTSAFKCYLRTRKICTNVGFFGTKSLVSDHTEIKHLTAFECKSIFESKIYNGQFLNQTKTGIWSTNNTLNVEYKWCCSDHCSSVENLIIEEGEVATWDGKSLISTLGDMGGCWATSGHCVLQDGVVIWNETHFSRVCPYELKNTYRIKIIGPRFIVDYLQAAFYIQNSTSFSHPNCPNFDEHSFKTEQGIVVRVPDLKVHNNAFLNMKNYYDTSEDDPLNAKLNYLEEKIHEFEIQSFRNVWNELCRQAQRHLDLVWQLLRLDATLGVRAFLQRTDIVSAFTGEALTIWPCKQVNATHVFSNHKVDRVCYQYLPVTIEDKIMFVAPGSQDLLETSQQVDCNHRHVPIYKQNGIWTTPVGKTHVSLTPLEIIWNGNSTVFHFSAPPIFHDKLAVVSTNLAFLKQYMFKTHDLELTVKRLVNYTSEMALHSSSVYELLSGSGKALGNTLSGVGQALEHVIVGTQQGMTQGLNNLLKGPLQMLINLAVIVAAIVAVIYSFYYLHMCKKSCVNSHYELPIKRTTQMPQLSTRPTFGQALLELASSRDYETNHRILAASDQRAPNRPLDPIVERRLSDEESSKPSTGQRFSIIIGSRNLRRSGIKWNRHQKERMV